MRNQGVVITNVVFMILAFSLGVSSYFLWNGVAEKTQQKKFADDQATKLDGEKSNLVADLKKLATKLGYDEVADEEIANQVGEDVRNDLSEYVENSSYRDVLLELGECLKAKSAEYDGALQEQVNASQSALDSETAKTDNQSDEFDEVSNLIANGAQTTSERVEYPRKGHNQALADADEVHASLKSSYDEQTGDLNKTKNATNAEIELAKQNAVDFREAKVAFAKINTELAAKVDELSNASFERADSEILYVDQALKIARIGVGDRDGVRPLTTFNVFSPDVLDMDGEGVTPKGSVQVVRAIGDHMSEVKILEDQMSDPIKSGDLVYTPLWRPGESVKYALDYCLDIDGDGRSDINKIMTLVQAAGADVATYIDEFGNVQHEDKIGPDIYRVVLARDSAAEVVDRDSTLDDETKNRIKSNEQDFLEALANAGVKSISLDEFLKKIGYKETATIIDYSTDKTVQLQENGVGRQVVSPGVVAPIYVDGAESAEVSEGAVAPKYGGTKGKAPVSPGVVSPVYDKEAKKAQKSPGVNSDYYSRKRGDKE